MAHENYNLPALMALADQARDFVVGSRSEATLRAYRSDWSHFERWCTERDLAPLPAAPETVSLYLTDHAGVLAAATLQRRLTSISQAHEQANLETPTTSSVVRRTRRGIFRTFGTAQIRKAPARTGEIRSMIRALDLDRAIGVRDRALLLVGYGAALRRSELVALDAGDLAERDEGLVVTVRRSKTDQEAEGAEIGVPYGSDPLTCPVRAVRDWRELAGIDDGPVFRSVDRWGNISPRRLSGDAVALVVKRHAEAAGLDPAIFAGHSLRAGLITAAAEAGVHERDIMAHSRHQSIPVMRRYIRGATLFKDNAAAAVGL